MATSGALPKQLFTSAGGLLFGVLCLCTLLATVADGAFLQEQLPLKVLVTTPTELLHNTSSVFSLEGRQAITVSEHEQSLMLLA